MFSKIRLVLAFPSRIPEVLGTALTSSSNFFINFVIIQALTPAGPPACLATYGIHSMCRCKTMACHTIRSSAEDMPIPLHFSYPSGTLIAAAALHCKPPGVPDQAFAVNPSRLLFPYIGVLYDLAQCCGCCRERSFPFSSPLLAVGNAFIRSDGRHGE